MEQRHLPFKGDNPLPVHSLATRYLPANRMWLNACVEKVPASGVVLRFCRGGDRASCRETRGDGDEEEKEEFAC